MQHNGFFKTGKHIQCSSNLSVRGRLMALAGGLENLPWATYQVLLGNSCVLSHWYHYCALCVTWRKVEWGSRTLFPESTWGLQVAVGGEKGGVCSRSFSTPISCCVLPLQTVPAGSDSQGLLVGGLVRVLGSKPQRAVRLGVPKRGKWRGQGNSSWWFRGAAEKSQVTCLGLLFSG